MSEQPKQIDCRNQKTNTAHDHHPGLSTVVIQQIENWQEHCKHETGGVHCEANILCLIVIPWEITGFEGEPCRDDHQSRATSEIAAQLTEFQRVFPVFRIGCADLGAATCDRD